LSGTCTAASTAKIAAAEATIAANESMKVVRGVIVISSCALQTIDYLDNDFHGDHEDSENKTT
jgi:hypothetical protein